MLEKLLKLSQTERELYLACHSFVFIKEFLDKVKKLQTQCVCVCFHHKCNISMTNIPLDTMKMSAKIFCKDNI